MSTVRIRRLEDHEEIEVDEGALGAYTKRGWFVLDGGQSKVSDVLEQVGDDPEKARVALEVERASDKPRKSLVAELERRTDITKEN